LAENVDRKGFLPSEIEAISRTLEPIEKAAARERQGRPGGPRSGKLPEHNGARTRDKFGAFAGVSGRTVEKIAAVVAAAEAEPEKYGKLAEAMDHRGRVDGPYRRLLNMRSAEQIRASPPPLPDGQWRVAVVDVPWPSEPDDPEPAERGYWTFATMSIEAICAVPIGSRLHDHSVLWFWATNFHMRYAYTILDAWGFRATPTIQTWGKPQPGRGKASARTNRTRHHGHTRQSRDHAHEPEHAIARADSEAADARAQAAGILRDGRIAVPSAGLSRRFQPLSAQRPLDLLGRGSAAGAA
jgi:MT-A70